MVKNTTGGTGTKGLARKHQTNNTNRLRVPECELEQFACVTKMLGNGMCEIYTNDNVRLIGHIRNKFRGKQKRHNMLSLFSFVLVGIREWENPAKNCDILTMYDESHIEQLKNIPKIKIDHILQIRLSNIFQQGKVTDDFDFALDREDDDEMDLSGANTKIKNIKPQQLPDEQFEIKSEATVDIDDI